MTEEAEAPRVLEDRWQLAERTGSPAAINDDDASLAERGRVVVVRNPSAPAVVLGSAQSPAAFDAAACERAGYAVVRRRSGGGAVLVRPGKQLWVDFFLPRGDYLFDDDVVRSFEPFGRAWASALTAYLQAQGLEGDVRIAPAASALRGQGERDWGRLLCFGAVGSAEVTVDGRKVVGLSQRRDRGGAWIYSMALLDAGTAELAGLLAEESLRREAASVLARVSGAVPGHDGAILKQALFACLPR